MSEFKKEYNETLEWDKSFILCKLSDTKSGAMIGSFTFNSKLFISRAKDGTMYAKVVPVKREKIDENGTAVTPHSESKSNGYVPESVQAVADQFGGTVVDAPVSPHVQEQLDSIESPF